MGRLAAAHEITNVPTISQQIAGTFVICCLSVGLKALSAAAYKPAIHRIFPVIGLYPELSKNGSASTVRGILLPENLRGKDRDACSKSTGSDVIFPGADTSLTYPSQKKEGACFSADAPFRLCKSNFALFTLYSLWLPAGKLTSRFWCIPGEGFLLPS